MTLLSLIFTLFVCSQYFVESQIIPTGNPCDVHTNEKECSEDTNNFCNWVKAQGFAACFAEWLFPFDMCFVIDSSESITPREWEGVKLFLNETILLIDPDNFGNQAFGIVTFDTEARPVQEVLFGRETAINSINNLPYYPAQGPGGATHTLKGVRMCLDMLKVARENQQLSTRTQFLMVLTDFSPNGPSLFCLSDPTKTQVCGPCDGVSIGNEGDITDDESMTDRIRNANIRTINVYLKIKSQAFSRTLLDCLLEINQPQNLRLEITQGELSGEQIAEFNRNILNLARRFCIIITPPPTRAPTRTPLTSNPTTSEPTTSAPTTSSPTTTSPTTSSPMTSSPSAPVFVCKPPDVIPKIPKTKSTWWWWWWNTQNGGRSGRRGGSRRGGNRRIRKRVTRPLRPFTCTHCDVTKDEYNVEFLGRKVVSRTKRYPYTKFCYKVTVNHHNRRRKYCDNTRYASDLRRWSLRLNGCCIVNFKHVLIHATKNGRNIRHDKRLSITSDSRSSYYISWNDALKPGTVTTFCYAFSGNVDVDNEGKYCVESETCGCDCIETPNPRQLGIQCSK